MRESKDYWFKRRRYGWGFFPVTLQGWLVILVFLIIAVVDGLMTRGGDQDTRFFIIFVTDLVLLFITLFSKSPSPHWRWGKKDTDNPDEDF